MYREISKILYDLFVVNPDYCGIQSENGNYYTKRLQLSKNIIQKMLEKESSIGVYQQIGESVKWICFDFDCLRNTEVDVKKLDSSTVIRFEEVLNAYDISYLKEFSGRRGIHIWIILDSYIEKEVAFQIVSFLLKDFEFDSNLYGIDLFPSTKTSSGKKLGKQVKLPLSTHKKGERSFFYEGEFSTLNEFNDSEQYRILEEYNRQKTKILLDLIQKDECIKNERERTIDIYKNERVNLGNESEEYYLEVIEILEELSVFNILFNKIEQGDLQNLDYRVLLGIDSGFSNSRGFFMYLMRNNPRFDEKISRTQLKNYVDGYGILTFGSLYEFYQIKMENYIKTDETAVDFFINVSGDKYKKIMQNIEYISELDILNDLKYTVKKERNYFYFNDEVQTIKLVNNFDEVDDLKIKRLQNTITEITERSYTLLKPIEYFCYVRKEDTKSRNLVSLGFEERILTTHLALEISYALKKVDYSSSFSYIPAFFSRNFLFFDWYKSWTEYTSRIKTFFDVGFYDSEAVMKIDIKNFYDSIDFLSVYRSLTDNEKIDKKIKNKFDFLIRFNDEIMKKITNSRKGVPQGPAYGRIISELYIDKVSSFVVDKYKDCDIEMLRYVDDIVVICPSEIVEELFSSFRNEFNRHGLVFNDSKSKWYNKIGEMTSEERMDIDRSNAISYEFSNSSINSLETLVTKEDKILSSANNYNIEECSLIFSNTSDEFYKVKYYMINYEKILSEEYGRGSIFIKIYHYLFRNPMLIEFTAKQNGFSYINPSTINGKNFISQLYIAIKRGEIDNKNIIEIADELSSTVGNQPFDISTEDSTTLEAIFKFVGNLKGEQHE